MIKAWKLNEETVAIVVSGEPSTALALAATGLEDRCLTRHEAQFHIPIHALHKYAFVLGLDGAALASLSRACPESDLMITVKRETTLQLSVNATSR